MRHWAWSLAPRLTRLRKHTSVCTRSSHLRTTLLARKTLRLKHTLMTYRLRIRRWPTPHRRPSMTSMWRTSCVSRPTSGKMIAGNQKALMSMVTTLNLWLRENVEGSNARKTRETDSTSTTPNSWTHGRIVQIRAFKTNSKCLSMAEISRWTYGWLLLRLSMGFRKRWTSSVT